MRILKALYIAVGLLLLAAVFAKVELAEVWSHAILIGAGGMFVLVMLYGAAFLIDSFTWQMAMAGVPLNGRWLWRAFRVRMVGEVFNNIMPAAGMGGEPVKAVLLNQHYGLGFREGTASIILGRTINMVAQVLFLAIGFAAIWASDLPGHFKGLALIGLGAFVAATAVFFYAQRLRVVSVTGSWLGRWRLLEGINGVLHHIRDMDERLIHFYTKNRGRFALAIGLAFLNWVAGAVEIYVAMMFLGHPVSFVDAWIIESVTQLVRTAVFFIPAALGAQEGAFLLIFTVMTGGPALGVAMALVRRARELVWLLLGAAFGVAYAARARSQG